MKNITQWLMIGFAVAVVIVALDYAFSIPVVQKSYGTGECVQVMSPEPAHTCENLPERYELMWVK